MPVSTWRFKSEDDSVRHIGPMAQDFMAAFGYGRSDKHIVGTDADGVALAAIQGLYELQREELQEQAEVNTALRWHNAQLEARLARLENAILREREPAAAVKLSGLGTVSFSELPFGRVSNQPERRLARNPLTTDNLIPCKLRIRPLQKCDSSKKLLSLHSPSQGVTCSLLIKPLGPLEQQRHAENSRASELSTERGTRHEAED